MPESRLSLPQDQIMETRQEPPAVACLRCRKHKLRCSRERPECRRCQRASSRCCYPAPPDRKRLALVRARGSPLRPASDQAASLAQEAQPRLDGSRLQAAQDSDPPHSLPQLQDSPIWSGRDGTTGGSRANLSPFGASAQVSSEVALLLFEIYFERHYQSGLLFRKKQLIEDYTAGKACNHVILAVFAFASLFLPTVPGGIFQGDIGIAEVSLADWRAIGRLWAEKASQQVLMTADKPCLELVQNKHAHRYHHITPSGLLKPNSAMLTSSAAIAYRASRLLQFDQVRLDTPILDNAAERGQKLRCFWACWLTKCASLENSRFQVDCWASVEGRPLPSDDADIDDSAGTLACCFDQNGSIVAQGQGVQLGLSSVLVMLHGLWWESQRFVRSIHGSRGTPEEWAAKYCSLDQRLQSVPDQLARYGAPILGTPESRLPSSDLSRAFSLIYIYELCLLYLHSSIVPVLSCRTQTPSFSRSMLKLAAEQASERSRRMITMTEQYISSKAEISKLWPMVGYGAYVCTAVQLRRCLALGLLNDPWIQRTRINLQLAGELCKYWAHLRPLFEDMERQFVQATVLAGQVSAGRDREHGQDMGDSLIDKQACDASPELSSHIRTYIAGNDDVQGTDRPEEHEATRSHGLRETANWGDQAASPRPLDSQRISTAIDPPSVEADSMLVDPGDDWEGTRPEPIWWNQDPGMFSELFGSGYHFLDDIGNFVDLC